MKTTAAKRQKAQTFCPLHINPLTPHWKDRWIYWLQRRRTAGFQFQYRLQKTPRFFRKKKEAECFFWMLLLCLPVSSRDQFVWQNHPALYAWALLPNSQKNKNKLPQASFFFFFVPGKSTRVFLKFCCFYKCSHTIFFKKKFKNLDFLFFSWNHFAFVIFKCRDNFQNFLE